MLTGIGFPESETRQQIGLGFRIDATAVAIAKVPTVALGNRGLRRQPFPRPRDLHHTPLDFCAAQRNIVQVRTAMELPRGTRARRMAVLD
jgi:hypothetical protein